jgi:hypothetical protein
MREWPRTSSGLVGSSIQYGSKRSRSRIQAAVAARGHGQGYQAGRSGDGEPSARSRFTVHDLLRRELEGLPPINV